MNVRFDYVNREGPNGVDMGCSNFARTEALTPGDTLSVITREHNPTRSRGYLYAYAQDDTTEPMAWNHLIGSLLTVDGLDMYEYGLPPLSFASSSSDGEPTDIDADGVRDLDGIEYGMVPERLDFPRFVGQGLPIADELVLIDLSGGAGYSTIVDFLVFNDNEEVYSAQTAFTCWANVRLLDISSMFDNDWLENVTNHDPSESLGFRETGWFLLDGRIATSDNEVIFDPAIYAVLIETMETFEVERASQPPFLDGSQGNGGLRPLNNLAGN